MQSRVSGPDKSSLECKGKSKMQGEIKMPKEQLEKMQREKNVEIVVKKNHNRESERASETKIKNKKK